MSVFRFSVVCDTTTQTEEFDYLFKTAKRPFDREDMLHDDQVTFYTGLPTLKLLDALYGHIAPHITRQSLTLTNYQELVMVLMKLRLNIPYHDLAYRFGVSISTVSRIFIILVDNHGNKALTFDILAREGRVVANYAPMLPIFFWKEDNCNYRLF